MNKHIAITVMVLAVAVVTARASDDVSVVDGFTLVQGNALNLQDSDLRTDSSVASLSEVVDILDQLWEAGQSKDQPLCVSEGFLRKTEAGWIFTPAIKVVKHGVMNIVSIPSGDQLLYWIVKRPASMTKG